MRPARTRASCTRPRPRAAPRCVSAHRGPERASPSSPRLDSPPMGADMLVREQPATDLAIATRILARAGALAPDGRITQRLGDVFYIGGRDVSLETMTPYDVAVVLMADGSTLQGAAAYLEAHRGDARIASVARVGSDEYLTAPSLRACVVAALRRSR